MIELGPASPCIRVCEMDRQAGWCRGCFRTIDEIVDWRQYDAEQRRAVVKRCGERRRAAAAPLAPMPSAAHTEPRAARGET